MAKVSGTFSIWSRALRHLAAACPGKGLLQLERPLSQYTSKQVERMVFKAIRLEEVWSEPDPTSVRKRELHRDDAYRVANLIPGGRWLLWGTRKDPGRIDYYDLEVEDFSPRVLVAPSDRTGPGSPTIMALSIEEDAPIFPFQMVIFYVEWGKSWHVTGIQSH